MQNPSRDQDILLITSSVFFLRFFNSSFHSTSQLLQNTGVLLSPLTTKAPKCKGIHAPWSNSQLWDGEPVDERNSPVTWKGNSDLHSTQLEDRVLLPRMRARSMTSFLLAFLQNLLTSSLCFHTLASWDHLPNEQRECVFWGDNQTNSICPLYCAFCEFTYKSNQFHSQLVVRKP